MKPTYTIATSGTDQADALQVTASIVTTHTVYQGSIQDLQKRIADADMQIAAFQDQKKADQAQIDAITAVFTAAGVTDLSQPLTDEQNTAIQSANDAANAALTDAQIADLQAKVQPLPPTQIAP